MTSQRVELAREALRELSREEFIRLVNETDRKWYESKKWIYSNGSITSEFKFDFITGENVFGYILLNGEWKKWICSKSAITEAK